MSGISNSGCTGNLCLPRSWARARSSWSILFLVFLKFPESNKLAVFYLFSDKTRYAVCRMHSFIMSSYFRLPGILHFAYWTPDMNMFFFNACPLLMQPEMGHTILLPGIHHPLLHQEIPFLSLRLECLIFL